MLESAQIWSLGCRHNLRPGHLGEVCCAPKRKKTVFRDRLEKALEVETLAGSTSTEPSCSRCEPQCRGGFVSEEGIEDPHFTIHLKGRVRTMTPEQAWATVKQQLQLDMPKTAFDTWVRPARLFREDGDTLTLGVPDEATQAWLAGRMVQQLQRQLAGCLGRAVTLRLAVDPTTSPSNDESVDDTPDPFDSLHFTETQDSLRAAILRPERIVAVPGYFLRWIPYLGPAKAWIVVALRQAFFFCHGEKPMEKRAFEAGSAQVARWSGLGRRTVWRHLKALDQSANPLSAFLTRAVLESGASSTFQFRMTMPLTPGDAAALETWFQHQDGRTTPEKALKAALELPPKALIPFPAEPFETADYRPRSVQEVALDACGLDRSHPDYARVAALADQLASRLMPPSDQIILTHYFLRHWLPVLGSGPGWLITVLRDQTYFNRESGELRDRVQLNDGYRTMAKALGIQRPKTLGDWLPAVEAFQNGTNRPASAAWQKRQETRAHVSRFLTKADYTVDRSGRQGTTWALKVRLDDPLIALHKQGLTALDAVLRTDPQALTTLMDGDFETEVAARMAQDRGADDTGSAEVGARMAQFRGADGIGSAEVGARVVQGSRRDWHSLKHVLKHYPLKPILKLYYRPTTNDSHPESEPLTPKAVGVGWDMNRLLELVGLSHPERRQLAKVFQATPAKAKRFRAWLIFGYSNKSSSDRKGIDTPGRFALSRYRTQPEQALLVLAQEDPGDLLRLIHEPHRRWADAELLGALAVGHFDRLLNSLIQAGPSDA